MKNDPEVPAREPEDRQKQNNMLLQVFKSGEFSVLSFNFEIRKLPKLKNSPSEWDYSYKTGRELAEMSKEELMDRLSFFEFHIGYMLRCYRFRGA